MQPGPSFPKLLLSAPLWTLHCFTVCGFPIGARVRDTCTLTSTGNLGSLSSPLPLVGDPSLPLPDPALQRGPVHTGTAAVAGGKTLHPGSPRRQHSPASCRGHLRVSNQGENTGLCWDGIKWTGQCLLYTLALESPHVTWLHPPLPT